MLTGLSGYGYKLNRLIKFKDSCREGLRWYDKNGHPLKSGLDPHEEVFTEKS